MSGTKETIRAIYELPPKKIEELLGIPISRGKFWFLIIVLGFIFLCALGSHVAIRGQVKRYAREHAREVMKYSGRK